MQDTLLNICNIEKNPILKIRNSGLFDELLSKTEFLDKHYLSVLPSQRIWHIKNAVYELQYCPVCKELMSFNRHYGYTYHKKCKYFKIEETKSLNDSYKKSYEKRKKENLLKYGVEHYQQTEEFKLKNKKTLLSKYGVDHAWKSEEVKEKIYKTNLLKYGTKIPSQSSEVKEKISETCVEKYGVQCVLSLDNIRNNAIKAQREKISSYFVDKLFNDGYTALGYKYNKNTALGIHEIYCPRCESTFMINDDVYRHRKNNNQEICTNCNKVNKSYSVAEKELLSFIQKIYKGKILENTKSIISPYESDIFLPELNIAIEYNGLYWHSTERKDQFYHKMKSDLCKEKGIHLIHVFGDDWMFKQEIIKSIISNFIGKYQKIYYARKCKIKELSFRETNDFLTNNHLLGTISSFSKCYGLLYDDELISLMSFKLLSKEKTLYELNRYAIKLNYAVVGGAKKLFKKFISENEFSEIITYNDNAVFKGDVYKKLGFSFVRTNAPNYQFITSSDQFTKRMQKQSIRKLKIGYKRENEQKNGLLRVYNAGNDVYKFFINEKITNV